LADDEKINWAEDPGWHFDVRVVIPIVQIRYLRKQSAEPLGGLRTLFVAFVSAFVLLGVVQLFWARPSVDAAVGAWIVAIALLTGIAFVVEPRVERPLSCESDATLLDSYRSRFFIRMGTANAPLYVGFVGGFIASPSVYVASLLLAVPMLVRTAPTPAALRRDQDELSELGCERSLVAALRRRPSE